MGAPCASALQHHAITIFFVMFIWLSDLDVAYGFLSVSGVMTGSVREDLWA